MQEDAIQYVRRCDPCQHHASIQHQPAIKLTLLSSSWWFAQWRIDILGPFFLASVQHKFLFIAVDYFTKLVEVEPVAQITKVKARDFI